MADFEQTENKLQASLTCLKIANHVIEQQDDMLVTSENVPCLEDVEQLD